MNLPKLDSLPVEARKVLLRADLDVGDTLEKESFERLRTSLQTINYLLEKNAKIAILAHRGRPEGQKVESLSLKPLCEYLGSFLGKSVKFIDGIFGENVKDAIAALSYGEVLVLENLRFDAREEENDEEFARELSGLGEVYINEAFAASHRKHASIVSLPKFLPHAAGFRLVKEVENLSKVFENPKRPIVVIIGGVKEDKLSYVADFEKFADMVLVAGKLPEYLEKLSISNSQLVIDEKILVAQLNQDKEDVTIHSVEKFEQEIKGAGTIVLSGPIGKFEDEGHRVGTQRVFEAVASSSAFKVAGGGDTEIAIRTLELSDKFDWISVGGGAMLEFLAKGTLPGLDALAF